MKSLRTKEFVEDNEIWVVGFAGWGFFLFSSFSVLFLLLVFFFKHSDRDYYKELRGK